MSRQTDDLRAQWAALGYVVTDEHLARAKERLDSLRPIGDAAHERNLALLAGFDTDTSEAA